jgi:2-desacetyl-2-hydroxyethyl bacteriochlorophyllide A dehydrogenase
MANDAVVFDAPHSVAIEDRAVPEPEEGEVLIETKRTLVSTGTELTILTGEEPPGSKWDELTNYPFEPGYNNIGIVTDTGENVDTELVGTRVATYNPHQQYVVSDADHCRPVPDHVTDKEAVFFTIAEIVMNGLRRGRVSWGETVAVYGLGLLGQFATRLCHFAGARPTIGLDIADSRLSYLPDIEGIIRVDPTVDNFRERVDALAGGQSADILFEVTGNPDAIPSELDLLREQGRFVLLSSPTGATTFDFHELCNLPSYEIIGAHNSSHPPHKTPATPWTQKRHTELYFDLIGEGSIDPTPLVSHAEPARKAPDLYDLLLDDRSQAMGVVLEW